MHRQSVRRLFMFEIGGNKVVVPVTVKCHYDNEHGFVVSVPKVSTSEARYEPYRFVAVPSDILIAVKDEAVALARHYDWQLAYEQDTKPV